MSRDEQTDAVDRITAQWKRERPDLDAAPMEVLGRIARIAALAQQSIDRAFATFGLTGADFDVLATLRRSGSPYALTPGALSRATMVTTGGMTKRLDRLEEAGLVERRDDPEDRRGKLVVLTSHGRALVDRAVEAHLENEERILGSLSRAQRSMLTSGLRTLLRALEEPVR